MAEAGESSADDGAAGKRKVIVVADAAALAKAAADRLVARISENSGRVAVCLTGGSSPRQLYELLATETCREQDSLAIACTGSSATNGSFRQTIRSTI